MRLLQPKTERRSGRVKRNYLEDIPRETDRSLGGVERDARAVDPNVNGDALPDAALCRWRDDKKHRRPRREGNGEQEGKDERSSAEGGNGSHGRRTARMNTLKSEMSIRPSPLRSMSLRPAASRDSQRERKTLQSLISIRLSPLKSARTTARRETMNERDVENSLARPAPDSRCCTRTN